jgi:hypothetical protein
MVMGKLQHRNRRRLGATLIETKATRFAIRDAQKKNLVPINIVVRKRTHTKPSRARRDELRRGVTVCLFQSHP